MSTFLFGSPDEGGHPVLAVHAYAVDIAVSPGVASIAERTNTAPAGIKRARLFAFDVDMCVFTSL